MPSSLQEIASEWEVRAMPTFLFIKDGKIVEKIVGANKDELESKVRFFAAETHTATGHEQHAHQDHSHAVQIANAQA